MTVGMGYGEAHRNITSIRGRAAEHECSECGGRAKEWAFTYPEEAQTLMSPEGRFYSPNPEDYSAMCRGCHRRHDLVKDERLLEVARKIGTENAASLIRARRSDPDLDSRLRAASSRNILLGKNFRDDPGHHSRALESALLRRSELLKDPESTFSRSIRENGRRNGRLNVSKMNSTRRRCGVCGMETNAGNLGRHQKRTGHAGWTERKE